MAKLTKPINWMKKRYFRVLGHYPTSICGLKFRCDPYHMNFWKKVSRGGWEPHTYEILSRFLTPDAVYFDLGAWIGTTVVYAARQCRQVMCFEPDPVAYRYLLWNIELNNLHNVMPFNIALADNDGIMKMASFGGDRGDSTMSLLNSDQNNSVSYAMAMRWDTWLSISKVEKMNLLKIDIEGGEFVLLPGMRDYLAEYKPVTYLSTHAPFVDVNERQEKMESIIEVMNVYGRCFNERMEQISISELVSEESLTQFNAYIFMD